jgi:hypothetical protein
VCYQTQFVALLLLSLGLAWGVAVQRASAADPGTADPENGTVVDGIYSNPYFALRYRLPAGWKEGPPPARPSSAGYYVLETPAAPEEAEAAILIAAQDVFFAAPPIADAMELVKDLARSPSEADGKALEPAVVTIAGHRFARVEIRGSPLSRIVLATDIRCHVVIFAFTGAEPERLKQLEASLDPLSLPAYEPVAACVKGYPTAETVLQKIEPAPAGPRFLKIPVRIIIGADGKVKHVHVIRAFPGQRKSIEDALGQWLFKPYELNGHPAEVETGLLFEFKPPLPQR